MVGFERAEFEVRTRVARVLRIIKSARWYLYWTRRRMTCRHTHTDDEAQQDVGVPWEGVLPWSFSFALLKGRNNFLCLDRLAESEARGELHGLFDDGFQRQLDDVLAWADATSSGDVSELSFIPAPQVWSKLSVSSDDRADRIAHRRTGRSGSPPQPGLSPHYSRGGCMGIRIRKAIGWGMIGAEVPTEGLEITNRKFAKWMIDHAGDIDGFANIQPASVLQQARYYAMLLKASSASAPVISRCVVSDSEFGILGVTVFVDPLHFGTWYRFDDMIDWYEGTTLRGDLKPSIRWRRLGLHPYLRGDVSAGVVALLLMTGMVRPGDKLPKLRECLYTYWA